MTVPSQLTIDIVIKLLQLEKSEEPDWAQIQSLSSQEIDRLNIIGSAAELDDVVYHFLEDCDIRRKDGGYAASQRRKLQDYLKISRRRTGE